MIKRILSILMCGFCLCFCLIPFRVFSVSALDVGYHTLIVSYGTNFRSSKVTGFSSGALSDFITNTATDIHTANDLSTIQRVHDYSLNLYFFGPSVTRFVLSVDYDFEHNSFMVDLQQIGVDNPYLFKINGVVSGGASFEYNIGGFPDSDVYLAYYTGTFTLYNDSSHGSLANQPVVSDPLIFDSILGFLNNSIYFESNFTPVTQTDVENAYNDGYTAGLNDNKVNADSSLVNENLALTQENNQLVAENSNLQQTNNDLSTQLENLQNSITQQVQNAQNSGYNSGYSAGVAAGGKNNFLGLFTAVVDAPLQAFTGLFDLEILGFNMKNLILGILSFAITAMVIRFAMRLFI